MSHETKLEKTQIVEQLAFDAWKSIVAARDIVLLSESNGEDIFTEDERISVVSLAMDAVDLVHRLQARSVLKAPERAISVPARGSKS